MSGSSPQRDVTVLMDAERMAETIRRMAQEIVEGCASLETAAFLGILTRGRPLADRLARHIEEMTGTRAPVGSLATTFYRDDIRSGRLGANIAPAETQFSFDVNGRHIILVDDVIAAGRTARAALDEVMDYGRPSRIQLACLIDRRVRELPIQPDYTGWTAPQEEDAQVQVRMAEIDGEDGVFLTANPARGAGEGA